MFLLHTTQAAQVCDYIRLQSGKIVEMSTAELFSNPKDAYTIALAAVPGKDWHFMN